MQEVDIPSIVLQFWRNRTKIKKTPSGWHTGNAPCCIHNGETQDKRGRGGIILDGIGGFSYHCFNCNFKTKFVLGKTIGLHTRNFMTWIGMDINTIRKLSLESIRKGGGSVDVYQPTVVNFKIQFDEHKLPINARLLATSDLKFFNYLQDRGLGVDDYEFYITPNAIGRNKNRIIIPYKYNNKIVGWTSRYLDKNKPKYLNEHQQSGYVFGTNLQNKLWNYVIVCEGILDAISINGLAVLHNDIAEQQMTLLNRLGKQIIVVIDQDRSGMYLAELAVKAGFGVSIPDWGLDDMGKPIHDINEAVAKYGKTTTLLSIMQAHETSKIKIKIALNKMKKRMNII